MHYLMHELAQNVSKQECFRLEANDKSINIPATVQHVSIPTTEIEMVFHLRNLRSLVITTSEKQRFYDPKPFVLPKSSLKKTLRLLKIDASCRCQLPVEIDRLIHLRYLVGSHQMESRSLLPHSICKLYHLQVLVWHGLISETTGMSNLVSLRNIHLIRDNSKNIKGVHKLTFLEQLTFYVGQKRGHHMDELKTLDNLRDLDIRQIENISDPAEAKNAQLSKKKNLTSLALCWTNGSHCENPEQITDNLQPSSSLRNLTISYYEGHRSPIWMRDLTPLEYLSHLRISYCPLWEGLPLLAQMPNLKTLELIGMSEVKEVDFSIDNTRNTCAFPSLKVLHCEDMPKWQSWAGQHNSLGFANLQYLEIINCPLLANLPAMPLSLFKFIMTNVGLNSLPNIYHGSSNNTPASSFLKSSLREVVIENCLNLKSLMNGFLHQDNIDLTSLEKLSVSACENIVQLPIGAFEKFGSLKDLRIYATSKLMAVDNQRIILPMKLQTLYFGNCNELDLPLLKSASHLTSLHELHIIKSANITCIPFSKNTFQSLNELYIEECDKLIEHSVLKYAQGVNQEDDVASLKIKKLHIPHLSLLFTEPLRSLRFVRVCHVNDCSGKDVLPEQWLLQNNNTLEELYISIANSLRSLPGTIVRLTALRQLEINDANLLEEIPDLPTALEDLCIHNARSLRSLPGTMTRLTALRRLEINSANLLEEIPELPTTLEKLYIRVASSLRQLPDTMVTLTALRELEINYVNLLEEIPELPTTLEKLCINNASFLKPLPSTMAKLTALRRLEINYANLLEEIPELPASLEELCIHNAKSLRSLPDTMVRLTALQRLEINNANLLEEIKELPTALEELYISNASSLRSLPDTMVSLTVLRELVITNANLLEQIPKLPASLLYQKIEDSVGMKENHP